MAEQPTVTVNGIEAMSPRYVLRQHVASLLSTHTERWTQTPRRAQTSLDLRNGDQKAPVPAAFLEKIPNAAAFRVDTPHKYLVPYHQTNVMAKAPPRIKRWARGDAQALKAEATEIEQIMQAVMDDRYPWRDSVDITLNQSVLLVTTMPDTVSMSGTPSLYDPDGKTIKARYQRNRDGKTKAEAGPDFRVSPKASSKVHGEDKRDYLSRRIPIFIEALGPTEFVPVFGPGLVLDAVLVTRWWTVTELLRRKWVWEGMEAHLSPEGGAVNGGASGMTAGRVKVTELYAVDWQEDESGRVVPHPYVAYAVDGAKTYQRTDDGMVDAVLDLYEEYGLTRLPCVLKWGPHVANPDPDKRGMPFPLPFAQSWLAIDAILTGAVAWLWWRGFPTLIEQPSAGTPPDYDRNDDSPDDEIEIEPFGYIKAQGNVTELGTTGPSPILGTVIDFLQAGNREEGPPNAAFGGGGESGFQASLARAFSEDAQDDVKDGCLEAYAESASIALELLTGMAERDDMGGKTHSIPIQRITPVPLGERKGEGRSKREILDLTADLAGGLYDLSAEYPPVPNLAKGQQYAEWASMDSPLILEDEFREEIMGDEHPEIFQARKLRQMVMYSPENLAKVMALAAQLAGDEEERDRLLAMSKQSASQGQDGQVYPAAPAAMLPPAGGAPGLTGAGGMPSLAGASLGGVVGGTVGAASRAAQAGGVVPDTVQLGPV